MYLIITITEIILILLYMSTKEGDWISANAMALDILWILSDYPHTKKKKNQVSLFVYSTLWERIKRENCPRSDIFLCKLM